MSSSERIESILLIFVGLFCMTAWYHFWVEPRDEIRFAIMDCMGDNSSKQAFDKCHQQILDARSQ